MAFLIDGGIRSWKSLVTGEDTFLSRCRNSQGTGEAYLSAFQYGPELRDLMNCQRDSVRGYTGFVGSRWLWFDIDRDDPDTALADTRRLGTAILERYPPLKPNDVLVFFSGSKGYHVGLPLAHEPARSEHFHRTCRHLAERLAGELPSTRPSTSMCNRFGFLIRGIRRRDCSNAD